MFFFTENDTSLTFRPISIECAYLLLLKDNLQESLKVFESIDSPRARWGRILIHILNGYTEELPTFFEIRNFLEIDLDLLLKNNKIDYIESLIGALEYFVDINPETYKFVARVMFENKLYNISKKYLDKSKSVFYRDPELHYLFAKYYINYKEYDAANFHIDECLKIIPEYYPAKKIKNEILEYLV